MDESLAASLVCPETKQKLRFAGAGELERLNAAIREGTVRNMDGAAVARPLKQGLVREDGRRLYPVREGIPVMLIGESLALEWENGT